MECFAYQDTAAGNQRCTGSAAINTPAQRLLYDVHGPPEYPSTLATRWQSPSSQAFLLISFGSLREGYAWISVRFGALQGALRFW